MTHMFLVAILVWVVPSNQPPDPVYYMCECCAGTTQWGQWGKRLGQARMCLNQLVNTKPGCTACKKMVLILLNGVRKRIWNQPGWCQSLPMLFCLAKIRVKWEHGMPKEMQLLCCPSQRGAEHTTLLQRKNPQSALSSNLCNGLKKVTKGSDLALVLLLPLPYKQVFADKQMCALNRAAGRHLWQLKRGRTTVMLPGCRKDTTGQLLH